MRLFSLLKKQRGNVDIGEYTVPLIGIVMGMVLIVIGIVLSQTVVTQAATAGSATAMGSFASAKSFNDLLPTIFEIVLLVAGISIIGVATFAGYQKFRNG